MRLSSALFAFAAIALALSPLACASVQDDDVAVAEAPMNESAGLVITEDDDGKTLTVTEGQDVLVRLPSNPTTGYAWEVVSTDRSFGYPVEITFIPDGSAIGSGGIEQFRWKTSGFFPLVGAHTVTMQYKRSWEVEPIKTFTFTVDIVPPANECPTIHPPAPGFCGDGEIRVLEDERGCTVGYDCERGCGGGCGPGRSCQNCWGQMLCIPSGAVC